MRHLKAIALVLLNCIWKSIQAVGILLLMIYMLGSVLLVGPLWAFDCSIWLGLLWISPWVAALFAYLYEEYKSTLNRLS